MDKDGLRTSAAAMHVLRWSGGLGTAWADSFKKLGDSPRVAAAIRMALEEKEE
jgi:hypothetical protein